MPIFKDPLPLSLYIHLPWCVKKCPYCDFNSHKAPDSLPEDLYIKALHQELSSYLPYLSTKKLTSVFFGGGTPSLFSGNAIEKIIKIVESHLILKPDVEITLEANPGTIDEKRFQDFYQAGINRLSLGVQSFQNNKLKNLGRIHDSSQAKSAIERAFKAGFKNINLDIMYGLPDQTIEEAEEDVQIALSHGPTHFSWYQLTIEPNTLFAYQKPMLPHEDVIWEMQQRGQGLIRKYGFHQYEVSAYSLPKKVCMHNTNYWEFGDYLGIGAGAHSKITQYKEDKILRFSQIKNPRDYLDVHKRKIPEMKEITGETLVFEFMLNALRLTEGVSVSLFETRTGLPFASIGDKVRMAIKKGLLIDNEALICASELGHKFLNNLIMMFL